MLAFPCSHCEKRLRVRIELAGKRFKCPACGKAITAPAAAKPTAPAPNEGGRPSSAESGPAKSVERAQPSARTWPNIDPLADTKFDGNPKLAPSEIWADLSDRESTHSSQPDN